MDGISRASSTDKRMGAPGSIAWAEPGPGDNARKAEAMLPALSSSAWTHLDQSYNSPLQTGTERPSTVSRSPSHTSASVNTYAGRRSFR